MVGMLFGIVSTSHSSEDEVGMVYHPSPTEKGHKEQDSVAQSNRKCVSKKRLSSSPCKDPTSDRRVRHIEPHAGECCDRT